jgi:hypothetical protein
MLKHLPMVVVLLLALLSTPCFGAGEARWIKVPKLYDVPDTSLRNEILARLPRTNEYNVGGGNSISFGHYGGHYMNSWMRNKYGNGFATCGIYVYGGYAFVCPQPRGYFTLSELVQRAGGYFPGGPADPIRTWNNEPFYVLDELIAYTHGTIAGLQGDGGNSNHTLSGSYDNAKHMLRISKVAVKLCYERRYPYAKEVDQFVRHVERVQEVCIDSKIRRR